MVEVRSVLSVADMSGVLQVRCVGVAKRSRRATAVVGDMLLVRIQKYNGNLWKRGQKVRALLVQSRKGVKRASGIRVSFENNSVVLMREKGRPLRRRLKGPLPHVLRLKGHGKIFALGGRPV